MRRSKRYNKCWNRETRRTVLVHRKVAEKQLGRPLLPGEIVHHRDGDSLNNVPENLLVLPGQGYHAHIEYHLRCERRGQPLLFPELIQPVHEDWRGTLFAAILPAGMTGRVRPRP